MASTSTQESDERRIQEKPDQCRNSRDQCCIKKVEPRENLGFYTCPKSGKRQKTCVQSLTDRKCPVKNCPVVVDRRDVKRHCLEEHHSEIFQTYHSKRLPKDSRFHQHRAYVVMLISKWLTGQERVTSKNLPRDLATILEFLQILKMNASLSPVFVNKFQDESAIFKKEGEEDNVHSEQEERTIVLNEIEEIHYGSEV
ncbi:Hypothetical predicted protein [Mytilus galloprovincialis]|uniref:Uncharacterized protein n=1 Tax=Mytilus galloprovincialis TaxID=29158 RepID=A0A8B6D0C9_MYTGA|nr:Hypothetical predicted protein [Mytilus galloprovincialis]